MLDPFVLFEAHPITMNPATMMGLFPHHACSAVCYDAPLNEGIYDVPAEATHTDHSRVLFFILARSSVLYH